MSDLGKGLIATVILIVFVGAVTFMGGFWGLQYKRTLGKAHQNADTEIFYESKAYVGSKKAEALKMYREYTALSDEDKKDYEAIVRLSFDDFDADKLEDKKLIDFVNKCKGL